MKVKSDEEIREEIRELFSQLPALQDLLKEMKVHKAEKSDGTKRENIASMSSDFDTDEAISHVIYESSLEEWDNPLVVIEKHTNKLYSEFRYITDTVNKFSSELLKSGVEIDELERQVRVVSALIRALANRINIMCENGINDMNSQLDIIRIKKYI